MAENALATAPTDPSPDTAGKGARPRLTYAQRAIVLHARALNPDASSEAIAETAGCSPRQVYRLLKATTHASREFTLALLESATTERLDDWARAATVASRKGYHQPAKDWLIAAKAIDEPKAAALLLNAATGITVNLAFALPGAPLAQTLPSPPHQIAEPHTTHSTPSLPHHTDTPQLPTHTADTRDIETVAIAAHTAERTSDTVGPPTLSPVALPHKANPSE